VQECFSCTTAKETRCRDINTFIFMNMNRLPSQRQYELSRVM
jgi:hypothetical protein